MSQSDRIRLPAPYKERTAELLALWERLWDAPGVSLRLAVESSRRLRSSAGRCYPQRRLIRLAPWVMAGNSELFAEVLCHEVAHIVVFEQWGRLAAPHGSQWRSLMVQAGFRPRARLPVSADLRARLERRRRHYLHECPVCGARRVAGRPVRTWRCVSCRNAGRSGRLVIRRVSGAESSDEPCGTSGAKGQP